MHASNLFPSHAATRRRTSRKARQRVGAFLLECKCCGRKRHAETGAQRKNRGTTKGGGKQREGLGRELGMELRAQLRTYIFIYCESRPQLIHVDVDSGFSNFSGWFVQDDVYTFGSSLAVGFLIFKV